MKIFTNPDKDYVEEVREKLKENDGYCPCRLTHLPDTKCMCKEFREQETGYCHCGLYFKAEDPKTITICGSTRFKNQILDIARDS